MVTRCTEPMFGVGETQTWQPLRLEISDRYNNGNPARGPGSAIPEPAACVLLLIGLVSLVGYRWRGRQR